MSPTVHVIGGKTWHYHKEGYVDAKKAKIGGVFSDEACRRICKKLDLN